MKKLFFMAFAAIACGLSFTSCSNEDNTGDAPYIHYRVLTFEDEDWGTGTNFVGESNWSSLIDSPQYGGKLLYPQTELDDYSYADVELYRWSDKGNTNLAHELTNAWGDYQYWGGGHAISNYISEDYTKASYTKQLEIPAASGHNGSKNFCVHNGYASYPGAPVPSIYFSDGKARLIDHMFVVNTSYTLNDMTNPYTTFKKGEDWLKIIATGYDAEGEVTGTAEFFLAKDGEFVTDWTEFDLTPLGKVVKVEFNVDGSDKNTWGLSTPAYFAYDDVTVQWN